MSNEPHQGLVRRFHSQLRNSRSRPTSPCQCDELTAALEKLEEAERAAAQARDDPSVCRRKCRIFAAEPSRTWKKHKFSEKFSIELLTVMDNLERAWCCCGAHDETVKAIMMALILR